MRKIAVFFILTSIVLFFLYTNPTHAEYNPTTGRFLQRDPLIEGMNLYNYVSNNPVVVIDPLGLLESKCKDCDCKNPQLTAINDSINEFVMKEIYENNQLKKPCRSRDALGRDVTDKYTRGFTAIDQHIHYLGDEYRRIMGPYGTGGKLANYKYADCIWLVCRGKGTCIGSDKISHFMQQGYMLYEIHRSHRREGLKRAIAFSYYTEGFNINKENWDYEGYYLINGEKITLEIAEWLKQEKFKFHQCGDDEIRGDPGDWIKVSNYFQEWGGDKFLGLLPLEKSIGDHNANVAGMRFWLDYNRHFSDKKPFKFDICKYMSNTANYADGIKPKK